MEKGRQPVLMKKERVSIKIRRIAEYGKGEFTLHSGVVLDWLLLNDLLQREKKDSNLFNTTGADGV